MCIYLDYAKAFDTLYYNQRLKSLLIRSILLYLFKSHWSHKIQSIKIKQTRAKERKVSSDVPQDTVIGPMLFNRYGNDLLSTSEHSLITEFAHYEGNWWPVLKKNAGNDCSQYKRKARFEANYDEQRVHNVYIWYLFFTFFHLVKSKALQIFNTKEFGSIVTLNGICWDCSLTGELKEILYKFLNL